jgi:uracil-DNA glycosylase family 4
VFWGTILAMVLDEIDAELEACRRCERLVAWREQVAQEKRRAFRDWNYWGKPVPGFGDPHGRVLVVGLAPGAHGSNRTGRMFTGDASGDFLYPALHRAGFASRPVSQSTDDDLILKDLYITAICRCVPPDNRPSRAEMRNCRPYLLAEIERIRPQVFVALGRIAFDNLLEILQIEDRTVVFAHAAAYPLSDGRRLVASYHPSRQNTQTGRLTAAMFDRVWEIVKENLEE